MNWGALLLITGWLAVMMFLIQRTEAKRRRLVILFMLFVGYLTWYWANYRGLSNVFFVGLVIALVLNYIFWLLIGRYNPVGNSDDIQVLGMDD